MSPYTKTDLMQHLKTLGVEAGDRLFIHSSYKSLGPVDGGAAAVVVALQHAVGSTGLILMPSFHLIDRDQRARCWDWAATPSTVGWLSEFFRRQPGTHRSDHYSHSVAARGPGAADFVSGHRRQEGLRSPWDLLPWGRTYGTHSPMFKTYQSGGKILMLGVDYQTSTYIHLVETIYWDHLRQTNPQASYPALSRPLLGAYWDATGPLSRGPVGAAPCRLFAIDTYVDTLLAAVLATPQRYLL
ncbi:MAG: hypothetical protein GKR89_29630 [Candidatus Latescibacteria bacterium]|nr:hypothetical protein [Candidatus Latescibacterota bacterium]